MSWSRWCSRRSCSRSAEDFLIQAFFIPVGLDGAHPAPGRPHPGLSVCQAFSDVTYGDVIVFSDPAPAPHEARGIIGGFVHWLGEGIGVARPEDDDFIKRVIALEGDTWEISRGVVFVNGERIREPYAAAERIGATSARRRFRMACCSCWATTGCARAIRGSRRPAGSATSPRRRWSGRRS